MTGVTRVTVGTKPPGAADVLDYALALIEVHGWNAKAKDGTASNDEVGYSLHDAIGEACTRLSNAVTPGRGAKDWMINIEGQARNLRTEANQFVLAAVKKADPACASDYAFNDKAKKATEVIAVLQDAKEAAGG